MTATKANEKAFLERPLFQSLGERYDLYVCLENQDGLSKIYNRYLNGQFEGFSSYGSHVGDHRDDDIVVFIHDDVEMLANNVESMLNRKVQEGFSLVGVAGSRDMYVAAPTLWNHMTIATRRSGSSIFHNIGYRPDGSVGPVAEQPWPLLLGPLGEVVVIDGVFMAVALDFADRVGWRFDEKYEFHHYDLSSCLKARELGLRITTAFIPIVHWSEGATPENELFKASERIFLREYAGQRHRIGPTG